MEKEIIILAVLVAAIIAGCMYLEELRAKVNYVDTPCPMCGSRQILDYGTDIDGNQLAHCYDCRKEFINLIEQ